MNNLKIRNISAADCKSITDVADLWWGRKYNSDLLTKWFFEHFGNTCFIAEQDGEAVGFALGFLSQTQKDYAYLKLVMVHPDFRSNGIGRCLYEKFFEAVKFQGRSKIRAVTTPSNKTSIKFHENMGFIMENFEDEIEGIPVCMDYDGRGGKRVVFVKTLD